MLNFEMQLSPSVDYLSDYAVPQRIEEICKDILKNRGHSQYKEIYDYLFEYAEDELLWEKESSYGE